MISTNRVNVVAFFCLTIVRPFVLSIINKNSVTAFLVTDKEEAQHTGA